MILRLHNIATNHAKAVCLIAGFLSALGFAPLGLWPLTLACLAVMMVLVRQAPDRRAALARGWSFGVGHFALGLNWIAGSFAYQHSMPHWLGWFAVVLIALYLALYPAVAAGLAWRWGRAGALPFTLYFAASWIVMEWLRASLFTGFGWNPLGVVLVDLTFPTAMARSVGTYGLAAWPIIAAGVLAFATQRWVDGIRAHWADGTWLTWALGPPILAVMSLFAVSAPLGWLGGSWRPEANGPRPMLRVVQPNIGQQDKHEDAFAAINFRKLAGLTQSKNGEPHLILWPEAAVPDFLEQEAWAREKIAALMGPKDVLLTGGVALVYGKDEKLTAARNSLFAMGPDAKLIGRYDKAHLVPYGEYLPMRPLLSAVGLSRLVPGDLDFLPGAGPATLALPGFGKVGVQICYEIVFSGQVVDQAHRPDFLFNPSNDAWFGAWGPPQHLAQARLRALEEGLPIIRSTPTGISAVIDANGRIVGQLAYQKPGVLDMRLPLTHQPTLFARFGNVLPLGFAALLTVICIALRRRFR
jgi:apolipoprotein N-acyltransferase